MPPDPEPGAAPPVRAAYDRIAEQFAETRKHPWPEVEAFLEAVPAGCLGLAVGCGNGRHVGALADRTDRVVGVDASRALLSVAAERCADAPLALVQGDAAALPLADGRVDVALYVATVHHLRSRAARVRSLDELARVLAPGGRALVSAWSTEHDRFEATGIPASEASGGSPDEQRESGGGFDTTVDWTLPDGETVPRFYHIYDPGEFRADLNRSDLRVTRAFVSSGNCYAEVKGERP
jgi:ubiquinone/menaquinone biosynthesis C-methylase UbiE